VQDRFVISFWVDPYVPIEDYDVRYKEIADANFTVVVGGFSAVTPVEVRAQLAAAEKHGLMVIPSTCGGNLANEGQAFFGANPECLKLKSPALWGFLLVDEPNKPVFPLLANWSQQIATVAPDALQFINLLPTCKTTGPYEEYVASFVNTVHPDLLCMDYYTDFLPTHKVSTG
jgi:hypothetical protein